MQELLILDNTELLLSHTPYFAALPKHTIMHSDASAVSATLLPILYNPVLDIFHARNSAGAGGMVRLVPDNFWLGTDAVMTAETSTNILEMALEPGATGRVWGYRQDSAGQDGLWLRTNAVAGTWSKIIGATNNDTQHIYKKTNGDLWYNNATAGNWYQLQAGAAGNAQTSVPSNLNTANGPGINGRLRLPDAIAISQYNFGSDNFYAHSNGAQVKINSTVAAPVFCTAPSTANGDAMVLWDNAWPTTAAFATNAICRLPHELVFYARHAAQVSQSAANCAVKTGLIVLNDTYTLIVAQYSKAAADAASAYPASAYKRFASTEEPFKTFTRVSLAILNRSSKVVRFIGFFNIPVLTEYSVGTTTDEPVFVQDCTGARLKNGVLELISTGALGSNAANTSVNGLIFTQIPLLKLDF